jgi:hypothetical protein
MQISRVPQTALAVLVLSALGAAPQVGFAGAASDSGTGATGSSGATGGTSAGGSTGASGTTGASGITGASGTTGASGATGSTGTSGATGTSGGTGTTGITGSSGGTGTSGATGTSGSLPTSPSGATAPTAVSPTGSSGTSGASGATGATGGGGQPVVTSITSQPETGDHLLGGGAGGGTKVSYAGGALAPSPSLFAGSDPLAGVLPGSVFDPLVSAAIGADVPQWYIDHFDVPSFLLPIYQAAGAAYGVPWEVLAAINQVETNFGSDLNVSSAGAIGWMQFLPSTWQRYGVDATGSGVADPYNAADAVFSAARYLNAAGASTNLPAAIFAYNHSTSYVESVLLRAELLSGVPATLVNSVSELSEGLFPIELRYHPSYQPVAPSSDAPRVLDAVAASKGKAPSPTAVGAAAKAEVEGDGTQAVEIFATAHAAAVAVQDGTVVAIGHTRRLGTYVRLRDAFGNLYTYGNLGSVAAYHLIAKPAGTTATSSLATSSQLTPGPPPSAPATAGAQVSGGIEALVAAQAASEAIATPSTTDVAAAVDTASPFAGFDFRPGLTDDVTIFGGPRLSSHQPSAKALRASQAHKIVDRYYTSAFGLARDQLEPRPLRVGSRVLAGTILGYLRAGGVGRAPHLTFELRPAGTDSVAIDPRPFLDAWTQLATLELHRAPLSDPLYGPELQSTDAGEAGVMSQIDLERVVLENTHLKMSLCERNTIAAGNVDRRVLASVEFLVENGLDPTIGGAQCTAGGSPSASATAANADSITITAVNSVAVGATATTTDSTIKTLLMLTGGNAPAQIAGPEAIQGAASSVADPSDSDQLVVSFTPQPAQLALASTASVAGRFALSPKRWAQLDAHLLSIPEPRVPTVISTTALSSKQHGRVRGAKKRS